MHSFEIGRWIVRPDVPRTLEAHSALTRSGAEECGCDGCRNFHAVRSQLLQGPLGAVLRQLGISPPWEVEVYESGRLSSGLHHYGGWFHFIGQLESGAPAWKAIGGSQGAKSADFEPLSSTVAIGLHTDLALVRPSFQGLPLVQLELSAELPWVIEAPEPQ